MSPSDESSIVAVRQFISECLRKHHAMQCCVRQEELFVLPISMSDDTVVVMPIVPPIAICVSSFVVPSITVT